MSDTPRQHTSGPWRVQAIFPSREQTFTPRVCILAKFDGRDIRVADIPDVLDRESEEMANAHLMASAPDLKRELAAKSAECQRLREALATLETAARRYASGLDSSSAYPLKLCDKARAALQEVQP